MTMRDIGGGGRGGCCGVGGEGDGWVDVDLAFVKWDRFVDR